MRRGSRSFGAAEGLGCIEHADDVHLTLDLFSTVRKVVDLLGAIQRPTNVGRTVGCALALAIINDTHNCNHDLGVAQYHIRSGDGGGAADGDPSQVRTAG